MTKLIALGVREGLSFRELSRRSHVSERSIRRWNGILRRDSAMGILPDRSEEEFVELLERSDVNRGRIEIVVPGERRIVIDGVTVINTLARMLEALEKRLNMGLHDRC